MLATDFQLDQLVVNCTNDVATIDPTFNLGDFYVTPIVFKSKKFVRKRSEDHPMYMGPILIHHRMNCASYSYFANQLVNLRPSLRGLITDGEQPLFTAMRDTFQSAVHLRCFRHFKENLVSKLHDLHILKLHRKKYSKIFLVQSVIHNISLGNLIQMTKMNLITLQEPKVDGIT